MSMQKQVHRSALEGIEQRHRSSKNSRREKLIINLVLIIKKEERIQLIIMSDTKYFNSCYNMSTNIGLGMSLGCYTSQLRQSLGKNRLNTVNFFSKTKIMR